jgi:hypothetical protein
MPSNLYLMDVESQRLDLISTVSNPITYRTELLARAGPVLSPQFASALHNCVFCMGLFRWWDYEIELGQSEYQSS